MNRKDFVKRHFKDGHINDFNKDLDDLVVEESKTLLRSIATDKKYLPSELIALRGYHYERSCMINGCPSEGQLEARKNIEAIDRILDQITSTIVK